MCRVRVYNLLSLGATKMPLLIHSQTHKNHATIHYSVETLVSTLRTHNQPRYKARLNLAIFFPPLPHFTTLSMNIRGGTWKSWKLHHCILSSTCYLIKHFTVPCLGGQFFCITSRKFANFNGRNYCRFLYCSVIFKKSVSKTSRIPRFNMVV